MTCTEIAEVVKKRRKRLGLSQQALAEKAYVHRIVIIKIEQGKNVMTDNYFSVLGALGLKLEVRA